MGGVLGGIAYRPVGVRRRVVEAQIRAAFPERDEEWIRRTARVSYRHFGREIAAVARASRLPGERLVRQTSGVGEARRVFGEATADGRGAVVVTGHLGNWELAGAFLAGLGYRVAAVVKRQRNVRLDRRLRRLREGLGVGSVYMAEAGRRLPPALEKGAVAALVADQDAGSRGVFVPFLGRPASTFRGPARLALECRVPLVFGALVREGDGYRVLARRVPAPGAGEEGPGRAPPPEGRRERELTRRWVARLEEEVRRRPEQYFWLHRRWKTRPPDGRGTGREDGERGHGGGEPRAGEGGSC